MPSHLALPLLLPFPGPAIPCPCSGTRLRVGPLSQPPGAPRCGGAATLVPPALHPSHCPFSPLPGRWGDLTQPFPGARGRVCRSHPCYPALRLALGAAAPGVGEGACVCCPECRTRPSLAWVAGGDQEGAFIYIWSGGEEKPPGFLCQMKCQRRWAIKKSYISKELETLTN